MLSSLRVYLHLSKTVSVFPAKLIGLPAATDDEADDKYVLLV